MKYTREQLGLMSDWQISGCTAEKLGHCVRNWRYSEILPIVLLYPSQADGDFWDFNALDDAVSMSLMKEYGVSLLESVDGWQAIKNNMTGISVYSANESPNRAIAECFLMMEIGK
jgi:hypothetical protein